MYLTGILSFRREIDSSQHKKSATKLACQAVGPSRNQLTRNAQLVLGVRGMEGGDGRSPLGRHPVDGGSRLDVEASRVVEPLAADVDAVDGDLNRVTALAQDFDLEARDVEGGDTQGGGFKRWRRVSLGVMLGSHSLKRHCLCRAGKQAAGSEKIPASETIPQKRSNKSSYHCRSFVRRLGSLATISSSFASVNSQRSASSSRGSGRSWRVKRFEKITGSERPICGYTVSRSHAAYRYASSSARRPMMEAIRKRSERSTSCEGKPSVP